LAEITLATRPTRVYKEVFVLVLVGPVPVNVTVVSTINNRKSKRKEKTT